MIRGTFVFEEDAETGSEGFKPLWIKGGEPTTSVAHDMLEHFANPNIPGLEGELMAVGAYLALRVETGQVSALTEPANNIIHSLDKLLEWAFDNRNVTPLKTYRLPDNFVWAENIITDVKSSMVSKLVVICDFENEKQVEYRNFLEANKDAVISWIRKGYRQAQRRYSHVDIYSVARLGFVRLNALSERLTRSGYVAIGETAVFSLCLQSLRPYVSVGGQDLTDAL